MNTNERFKLLSDKDLLALDKTSSNANTKKAQTRGFGLIKTGLLYEEKTLSWKNIYQAN